MHISAKSFFKTVALATATAALLTGCANMREVPMHPAANANDPACAEVIVRLPDDISGDKKRRTNAQSTGAWGDPVSIELFCGIEPSGPTTDRCVNVSGIDWIIDDSNAPLYRFEAYGRNPGLEVYVHSEYASGTEAVLELGPAVSQLPQERECLNLYDSF